MTLSKRAVLQISGGLALAVLTLAFAIGGSRAASGFAVGLAGSSFNLWALWAAIGLLAKAPQKERLAKFAAAFVVVAFFAKLPVFVVLWFLSQHIGAPAPSWFLIAIGLVYSVLVGWSLASR